MNCAAVGARRRCPDSLPFIFLGALCCLVLSNGHGICCRPCWNCSWDACLRVEAPAGAGAGAQDKSVTKPALSTSACSETVLLKVERWSPEVCVINGGSSKNHCAVLTCWSLSCLLLNRTCRHGQANTVRYGTSPAPSACAQAPHLCSFVAFGAECQ